MQEEAYDNYTDEEQIGFAEDNQEDVQDDTGEQYEELDQQEEYPEEEREPEPEPVVAKKKNNIGERLSQVQRERYEAIEEAQRLRSENERLRSLANMSTQTALEHYDKTVIQKVHSAKEQKIKALEIGDIHAQAEADVALALATAEYQNLANMKAQHNYQQPNYQQQYEQPQQQAPLYDSTPQVVEGWVSQNDWFNPTSENYDDELSSSVGNYCTALDNNLYRAGRGNEIMSPQYFQAVDEYVNQVRAHSGQQRGGDLNMRPARNTVSPVRGGGTQRPGPASGQTKVGLNPEEVKMARLYGVDPKVYLQYKIKDAKDQKDRGRR